MKKTFDLEFKFEKKVMVCFLNVYVQNKMAINEEDLSISVQKYTVLFDKGHKELKLPEKFSSIRHLKVETNAPEICLSKFVILIQALLFLFNNVTAAFLRRRRRFLKIISVAAKR